MSGESLSEKVVWQLIPPAFPASHRMTVAERARKIQLLLGHASVQTTERYPGTKQDLVNAPNDGIKLRVSAQI